MIFTIRRTAHVVAASIAVELALDFGAAALAVVVAPFVGDWVYAAAGVIVIGSLPVLVLNIARVARREWKRHHRMSISADQTPPPQEARTTSNRARHTATRSGS
jgi:hypothetical protein